MQSKTVGANSEVIGSQQDVFNHQTLDVVGVEVPLKVIGSGKEVPPHQSTTLNNVAKKWKRSVRQNTVGGGNEHVGTQEEEWRGQKKRSALEWSMEEEDAVMGEKEKRVKVIDSKIATGDRINQVEGIGCNQALEHQ